MKKMFFLIEIPLIEIKWIWLQLNTFTTFYDLMRETVIGTFFWAVLKTKFTVRCLIKHTFITEDQQTTRSNNKTRWMFSFQLWNPDRHFEYRLWTCDVIKALSQF